MDEQTLANIRLQMTAAINAENYLAFADAMRRAKAAMDELAQVCASIDWEDD